MSRCRYWAIHLFEIEAIKLMYKQRGDLLQMRIVELVNLARCIPINQHSYQRRAHRDAR
jgi:hypothetical protein